MVTEARPLQYPKALLPIEVTELGIMIEVRPEQPENALVPIVVTELGNVTEIRPLQPKKVLGLIDTIPSFMTIDVLLGISPLYSYATFPI